MPLWTPTAMPPLWVLRCLLWALFMHGTLGQDTQLNGDYCKKKFLHGGCCPNRMDECSMPILGTLCYCDEFCERDNNPDCCPDYEEHCLGRSPPEFLTAKSCQYKGQEIRSFQTVTFNCNKCTCSYGVLDCDEDACAVDEDLFEKIRSSAQYGFQVKNYTKFWGKKLRDGMTMLTGTHKPTTRSYHMYPVDLSYDASRLPRFFDARQEWPGLVGEPRDQGWCASSWAVSSVTVAQDRLAVLTKGRETIALSPQHLLSCNRRGQQACGGGHVERAWSFLRKRGVVPELCYPYESGQDGNALECKLSHRSNLLKIDCPLKEFPMDRVEFYTTEPTYRIASNEDDIKYEILRNGPVQAIIRVHPDLFLYSSGVYSHTGLPGTETSSTHSVRLIGWGEEPGPEAKNKYWIAANSWGKDWGEGGFFRIARGRNESDIETFILAVRSHPVDETVMEDEEETYVELERRRRRRRKN